MEATQVIQLTKEWIVNTVIGCNFCPFAAREVQRNSIRYCVEESTDQAACLLTLIRECEHLDNDAGTETTFFIFQNAVNSFRSYLDLVDLSEQLLKKQRYGSIYQIASFHPKYRFSGAKEDDAANYTNRSPYPMLQLLREASITTALAHYAASPDTIPENNIAFARRKGLDYMKQLKESAGKGT